MAIRIALTPSRVFNNDFTWNDTVMIMIALIECNLTIINAAYPSVRSFLNKVSTGFLVAETAKDTESGVKGSGYGKGNSNSYGLKSLGGNGSRSIGARVKEPISSLRGDKSFQHHSTAVKGDMKSDRSFGSEVIMVRRSIEIDAGSTAETP